MKIALKPFSKKSAPATAARRASRRTTVKRTAMVGALSLASALAFVQPASADTNLRGIEHWDTDKMMMTLCNGSQGMEYWFINVDTGQLTRDPGNGGSVESLPHPYEMVQGWCSYPQASSWTWTGPEKQVGNSLANCSSSSTLRQDIQMSGSTTSTTSNSVTGSVGIEWNVIEKVLSLEAGASYQRTWSYAKTSGWSSTIGLTVPPNTVGWMALRPQMRTVRSNPVFHITKYTWGTTGSHTQSSNSWRGRGYSDIKSFGAFYDAKGNVLDGNGKPAGQYVARDRAKNGSDCR